MMLKAIVTHEQLPHEDCPLEKSLVLESSSLARWHSVSYMEADHLLSSCWPVRTGHRCRDPSCDVHLGQKVWENELKEIKQNICVSELSGKSSVLGTPIYQKPRRQWVNLGANMEASHRYFQSTTSKDQ